MKTKEEIIFHYKTMFCPDLAEGLNYGVDWAMYESDIKVFNGEPGEKREINLRTYCEDLYKAYQKSGD